MSAPLDILDWPSLAEDARREVLRRPAQRDASALLEKAGRASRWRQSACLVGVLRRVVRKC